jgi:hypothetical protein
VPGADPVQQVMHDVVLEPVTHRAADPSGTHPALLAKHPKCLRDGVFRAPYGRSKIADADARRSMQAEQELEPVGIGQQVEPLRPAADVNVRERRRRPSYHRLLTGLHG